MVRDPPAESLSRSMPSLRENVFLKPARALEEQLVNRGDFE